MSFLQSIACTALTVCEAVGGTSGAGSDTGDSLGTVNGGTTWTSQALPAGTGLLSGVACTSATTCHVVGSYTSSAGRILVTTDGGTMWTDQSFPPEALIFSGISCASATNCFAFGFTTLGAGVMFATTDSGSHWANQSLPPGITAVNSVACLSATDCFGVGGGPGGAIVNTTDGGGTWTGQTVPAGVGFLASIACTSLTACYVAGSSAGGAVILSQPRLAVETTSLPAGTVGTAYSATLNASDGSLPYVWSITSGSLPSGLSLDPSTGAITGSPTSAGTQTVTFEVTDASSQTAMATLPIGVFAQPGVYVPLTPVRICDTRPNNPSNLSGNAAQCRAGTTGRTLAAGGTLTFDVAGDFGVPASNVTAAVLNVATVNSKAAGHFTLYPAGQSRPTASNLNFVTGQVVPNLAEVGVGAGGAVSLYSSAPSDAVIDLEGYVTTTSAGGAGLYNALPTPARICDTRGSNPSNLTGGDTQCNPNTAKGSPDSPVGPGNPLTITVDGNGGVPALGVSAVVLNASVVKPTAPGYVTAYPTGQLRPTASNVNYLGGQVVGNRVIVPVSGTGQVNLYATASTDLIVDVSGYFTSAGGTTGARFTPEVAPVRICDTRGSNPSGLAVPYTQCNTNIIVPGPDNPLIPNSSRPIQATGLGDVPTGADAAVLNVTDIAPTAPGNLIVYPSGIPPTTSDLNPPVGGVAGNLVVATLNPSGSFNVDNRSAGHSNLVVDLEGWYSS